MLFTSFEFLFLFLPLVLFLYYLKPNTKFRVLILVVSSLFFYSFWNYRFLPLLIGSVLINFYVGKLLTRHPKKSLFIMGVIINLLPLLYYKYSQFFLEVVKLNMHDKLPSIILPLGISFYTFQQISYLADIYQNKTIETNLLKYAFFVLFFPKIFAGPIVHYNSLIPQIGEENTTPCFFSEGLIYFAIGLLKKIVLADTLGYYVDPIYQLNSGIFFSQSVIATLGFTFQLYFDFSGYSDMALGLGRMFGYRLPINFNSPYKASSISDFWRRWHITLSNFLRDYIYIPLGGSKEGASKQYSNLLITMFIGGLWHGAGWTFVIWGIIHGLLLSIQHLWNKHFTNFKLGIIKYPLTFIIISLTWVIFRAENLHQVSLIYSGFKTIGRFEFTTVFYWIAFSFVIMLLPNSNQLVPLINSGLVKMHVYLFSLSKRVIIYSGLSLIIISLFNYSFYEYRTDLFIYKAIPIKTEYIGISNKVGDYRSNLFVNEIFKGNDKKVIFVGSSFTKDVGVFNFTHKNLAYKSGTIGMGGNYFNNALRGVGTVLEVDNVDTVIIGISPLNLGSIKKRLPFEDQALGSINSAGFNFEVDPFQETLNANLTFKDYIHLLLFYKDDRYYQIHGFYHNLVTRTFRSNDDIIETINMDVDSRNKFYLNLKEGKAGAMLQVKDQSNGQNTKFNWEERGILDSLQPDGDIYKAFKNLKILADEKNIRMIVYDTPTPLHEDAPDIYPVGFLDEYRGQMNHLMAELGIEYFDLIEFFPWKGEYMNDFIHPNVDARKELHKHLIYSIFPE